MKYIITWEMHYKDMDTTIEYYDECSNNEEPFVRAKEQATIFNHVEDCSTHFARLIKKYPEMDLKIWEVE